MNNYLGIGKKKGACERLVCGLLAGLLVGLILLPLWRAGATSTLDIGTPSVGSSGQMQLVIDDKNIYPGMDKAYENGYMPIVADGKVQIVVPLLAVNGAALQNQIRVSLNLGDASGSPFVFQNFSKTISLAPQPVQGSDVPVDVFLIQAELQLLETRYMGRYPVTVKVEWQDDSGDSRVLDIPLFVTITDGIDPNITPTPMPDPPPIPVEKPKPAPKIILSRIELSEERLTAGGTIEASVTFLNTSTKQDISNIKITVNPDSLDLSILGGTGSFYIDKIASEEEATIVFTVAAAAQTKAETKIVTIDVEYEGANAAAFSETERIRIPVHQPIKLDYDKPQIPQFASVGDTLNVSFNLMNLGISTIYNARVSVEAPGFIPDKSLFFGQLDSGSSKQQEMYIFITRRTKGGLVPEDGNDYGGSMGVVTITYEDSLGEVFEERIEFETYIEEMVIPSAVPTTENVEEKRDTSQWQGFVIGAGLLIGAVIVYIVVRKRAQKRRFADFDRVESGDDEGGSAS